jgi:hypothetical protein
MKTRKSCFFAKFWQNGFFLNSRLPYKEFSTERMPLGLTTGALEGIRKTY